MVKQGIKDRLKKAEIEERALKDQKDREIIALAEKDRQQQMDQRNGMNLYKQTLLSQMQMNEQNKKNFGRMTFVEKKMNRNDLKAYQHKEKQTVNAMIPGINMVQGIGSKPLMRGALQMIEESQPLKRRRGGIYFQPERNTTEEYYTRGQVYNNPLPTQSATAGKTMIGRAMTPT